MASISGKPFERADTAVQMMVENLVGKLIERRMKKIENAAIALQMRFFKYLAVGAGVIGSDKAPVFPDIDLPQPVFKPLKTAGTNASANRVAKVFGTKTAKVQRSYKDRKNAMGLPGNSFFLFKGKLQNYLSSVANPVSMFGKPNVFFTEFGQAGSFRIYSTARGESGKIKLSGLYTVSGNRSKKDFKTSNRIGKMSVDLFPKLMGQLQSGTSAQDLGFPRTMAYRLDNFQGGKDRHFMPQYIQWWVRVKGREMMRRANNAK